MNLCSNINFMPKFEDDVVKTGKKICVGEEF